MAAALAAALADLFDNQARHSKPDAAELAKRNRESGLVGHVKIHSVDPDTSVMPDGYAWISLAGTAPVLKVYRNRTVYQVALA